MTGLPQLPENLRTQVNVGDGLIPEIPRFPNLPNITQQLDNATKSLLESDVNLDDVLNTEASEGVSSLVNSLIPSGLVDRLSAQYRLPDGSVDFDKVTEILDERITNIEQANALPELPDVSVAGLLERLIPSVPVIPIPTPAQLLNRVNELIEQKKLAQQRRLMQTQLESANLEKTPFTARRKQTNDISRLINASSVLKRPNL